MRVPVRIWSRYSSHGWTQMGTDKRKMLGRESRWVIGVDLGQKRDYSAVAALEVFDAVYDERDPVTLIFGASAVTVLAE